MKVTAYLFASIWVTVILLGSGCAIDSKRVKGSSGGYGDPKTWVAAAETHEKQGDLQGALFEYRVARALAKQDPVIKKSIKRIESQISKRTKKMIARGNKAVRQGKTSKARRHYLETLGLEPNNKDALEAMRRLDEKSSRRSMERKVALSQRNYKSRRKKAKNNNGYGDETYTYSRQAILQAGSRPASIDELIKELKKHIAKYPNDLEMRSLLSKTRIGQAEKSYQAENYSDTLSYLEQAESAVNGDRKKLQTIIKIRKEYGKGLYIKGLRSSRSEPKQALKYWEHALKFNPDDKRTQLRIQKINTM
ncbi:MAG: hypothetical protein KZQ92_06345 [Candidatus Thiodiazotropha sp. (ex Lucinoma borealis)]|nr:hypothetical protein [Candidatus Thiodiazotropha sp. (ex Lucinoma borealis)]